MKETTNLRDKAEILATLANFADLGEMKRSQKEKLVEDVRAAGLCSSPLITAGRKVVKFTNKDLAKSWGTPYIPNEWLPIVNAHRWVHPLINEILSSGQAAVSAFFDKLPQPAKWVLEDSGKLIDRFDAVQQAENDLLLGFVEVSKAALWPFRRCALCNTVFVRAGKQKFCSKRCADKAVGSRTEYMRVAVAKWRKKEREKKLSESREGSKKWQS